MWKPPGRPWQTHPIKLYLGGRAEQAAQTEFQRLLLAILDWEGLGRSGKVITLVRRADESGRPLQEGEEGVADVG